MNRSRTAAFVALIALLASVRVIHADVRADEKTRVEFGGMLGRMVNLFGGKAAREGTTSTVAVKGDRKATLNESTGQIVDLAEEKVYDLDMKKKTYRVTTFAELRRRMEEARKKAEEDAKKAQEKPQQAEPQRQENNLEVDFNVKNTGEKKTVNGFDTHQSIVTIAVREKGKTLEQSGGLVLTSDMWLAPRIAAMKEIADFDIRYAQKLYGPMFTGASAEQMAAAMALYPMMKQAFGRWATEAQKIEGTPILTTLTTDAVKSEEQMAQEAKQAEADKPSASGGVGGLIGGLARKAAAKKMGGDDAGKQRATVMTGTTEVLKVVTDVTAADVAVPAGFKEAK